jgi:heptosyltransferase-2
MVEIKKILFVTLSNIGDCIMTLPALDALKQRYPDAQLSVVAGPRPRELFDSHLGIHRFIVYDKHLGWKEKTKLTHELKSEKFDVVVDLRNSFFQVLLAARYKTSPLWGRPRGIQHMKDRHLYRVYQTLREEFSGKAPPAKNPFLQIKPEDEEAIKSLFKKNNITQKDQVVVVAAGARSDIKRWPREKFAEFISLLDESCGVKVILVGDKDDVSINRYIARDSKAKPIDLSGKTSLAQLACLLSSSSLLVTNDSAVLHLASYLNVPVVALFGPTDELKYGPWSKGSCVVKKDIFCRPCSKAQCRFGHLKCMHLIKGEDVLRQVKNALVQGSEFKVQTKNQYRRILIVRTDRIGDVVLSTPVIKALREAYPTAFMSMMVSPLTKDIVEGNPYLDKVIIYDKEGRHKSWWGSMQFAYELRKKRFDLALVLHPTNRVHLVTFFAGIPRRVGYNRKLGVLLTDRIRHTKQRGEKHESEYNLDLVRSLGIEPKCTSLFVPMAPDAEKWVEGLFFQKGIKDTDKLLVIHPGASCLSKIWPNERFAHVAERLADKYGFKIFIVAGPKDKALAEGMIKNMHHAATNLAGKISLRQLTSLLRHSHLFISNDSGPVHIASALDLPVISILARNEPGLSPRRWGPQGKQSRILHKEVGCVKCLAHNCLKEFKCLKAISVDDVLGAADSLLKDQNEKTFP